MWPCVLYTHLVLNSRPILLCVFPPQYLKNAHSHGARSNPTATALDTATAFDAAAGADAGQAIVASVGMDRARGRARKVEGSREWATNDIRGRDDRGDGLHELGDQHGTADVRAYAHLLYVYMYIYIIHISYIYTYIYIHM